MALVDKLNNIGDAIRSKTGGTEPLTLDEMVTEITGIETECGYDSSGITFQDRTTGRAYILYVDTGKLMLEESSDSTQAANFINLIDSTTGVNYSLYIDNGKLVIDNRS